MPAVPFESASDFAALLRRFRQARGLSQEEVAAKAGISVTSISYLERGLTRLPHRDTVELLFAALVLSDEEAAALTSALRRARAGAADSSPSEASPSSASGASKLSTASWAASADATSAALPSYRLAVPLTPLLGREREEATVLGLLARESVRLLTLTGPAGVGKTRLALQVADTLRARQDFDLVFVDLVAVPRADRILQAIGQAIGVRDAGELPLLSAMISEIGERRVLLVLDNFEHLLAGAPLCAALLGACPRAKALVTSRALLNIRGEHELSVQPLPLPRLDALPPLAELEQFGSVALFAERARAVRSDFALDTEERGRLVASICVRSDGLPLAIELAAAQVKHFPLEELATRLTGVAPLDLLVGGPRDLADHQRAIRSTVAWSYDLLSTEERRVFRALGAFVGGATVDGVRMIVGLDEDAVQRSLAALVDANLIGRLQEASGPRYDQLVIVRAFAHERLIHEGEFEAARRALAEYITGLVDQVNVVGVEVQKAQLDRLVAEHDNIRAVLDWVVESGEVLTSLRLGAKLRGFWETRGFLAEGADWLERLLAHADPEPTPDNLDALANAWKVMVVLNHRLSRFERAVEAAERVLDLTRRQDDPSKMMGVLNYLANPLGNLGELERAEAMHFESLALARAEGNKLAEEVTLLNLGDLRTLQGRYDDALAVEQEAMEISRSLSEREASRALLMTNIGETYIMMDRPAEAMNILTESQHLYELNGESVVLALYNLGRVSWRLGDYGEALAYLDRTLRLARAQDDVAMVVGALCVVVGIALQCDDVAHAKQALEEILVAQARVSDRRIRWRFVERAGGYASRRGAWEAAVHLYAAAEQWRGAMHDLVDPVERDLRARDRALARDALGEPAFSDAGRIAEAYTLEVAIEQAHSVVAMDRGTSG